MKKDKRLIKLAQEFASQSFVKGRLSDAKVLQSVKSFKKLSSSQTIFALTQYLKFLKLELKKSTLLIESGSKLTDQQLKQVAQKINSKFKISNYSFLHNPSLLGGLRLKLGDTLYDYSLKGRINQIKDAIAK